MTGRVRHVRPLSARNPRIQRLARLARRPAERAEQRALLVEGPTVLATALELGAAVREVYVDEAAAARPAVTAVLDRLAPDVDRWTVPGGVLDRVGDAATSQGTLAVVEWGPRPLDDVVAARPESGATVPFVVVLVDVADPGNVGTLLRAAVAAGASSVVSVGGADPSGPKAVRSSAGALFAVPVVVADDVGAVLDALVGGGVRSVGTVVDGAPPYDACDLTGPVAVFVGNEARGLPAACCDVLDELVTIPMAGPTESLNVAMAGTVLCFEVLRQRRRG